MEHEETVDQDALTPVERYAAARPAFLTTTGLLREQVAETLSGDGIEPLFLDARTKTVDSFQRKIQRQARLGRSFEEPARQMHDLCAIRVITALPEQVPEVVRSLKRGRWFYCLQDLEKATAGRESGIYGYTSRHLVCSVRGTGELGEAREPLTASSAGAAHRSSAKTVTFEIQIRTILSHAWAEIEHDIRYKNPNPAAWTPALDRTFTQTAGLLEAAETAFSSIHNQHRQLLAWHDDPEPLTAANLTAVCDVVLPHVDRNTEESLEFALQILADNAIVTTAGLMDLLGADDVTYVRARMVHSYEPGLARLIDDLLLNKFGEEHIRRSGQHGGDDRTPKLRSRLRQLTSEDDAPLP